MANMAFDQGYRSRDPLRSPLICLSAANQLSAFNSIELSRYKIKSGDTLQSIASLFYGSKWLALWTAIANVNGLTNPVALPVGTVIIIPDVNSLTL
jgi:nucleoid-associated protein YgaU